MKFPDTSREEGSLIDRDEPLPGREPEVTGRKRPQGAAGGGVDQAVLIRAVSKHVVLERGATVWEEGVEAIKYEGRESPPCDLPTGSSVQS